ncbi:MAG: hypothetical protein ABI409_21590 [Ramlibacter sp.]
MLTDVVHARAKSSRVDLWVRNGEGAPLKRIALDLFMPEAAAELVGWMPALVPLPESVASEPVVSWRSPLSTGKTLAIAVIGITLVVGLMLILLGFLLSRRGF